MYSYTLECSKCWEHGYGWVLYYFLELFPITVLYILVVIFNIKASSSPLSALVFMSHFVVYTIRLNITLHMYIENENKRISVCCSESAPSSVWYMELRLLSMYCSTILCKQAHQDCSCTCTGVCSGILSHLSDAIYLCMYKTP